MPYLRRRVSRVESEFDMRPQSQILGSLTLPVLADQQLPRSGSTSDLLLLPDMSTSATATARSSLAMSQISTKDDADNDADEAVESARAPATPSETSLKTRRFSMRRFRNASDSQLAAKAKMQAAAEKPPPLPRPPEIITTAPTSDASAPRKKASRLNLAARLRKSVDVARPGQEGVGGDKGQSSKRDLKERRKTLAPLTTTTTTTEAGKQPSVSFEQPPRSNAPTPPAYGDESASGLALPVTRLSESSRSDESGSRVYGSTTTTTVSTTTTFFRLPRRKPKQPEPMFPIGHLAQKKTESALSAGPGGQNTPTQSRPSSRQSQSPALALFARVNPSPATALFRPSSRGSGQSSPTRRLTLRGRSSTMGSMGRDSARNSVRDSVDDGTPTMPVPTARKSFSDLLGFRSGRNLGDGANGRQGTLTPVTPGSSTSKNNSLQLARDAVVLPERHEDDTPGKYLERLLGVVSRSVIAASLSKGSDPFSQSVLRSYMRSFMFFEDPMDMAIRKLLMEAELPKETQQIDRTLQAFANRYHECNPGIYANADQAYFVAFSLLILHTDVFNKNNKHKMQKADYLKNTRGEGIFDEILEVFYDNITYTPFIHVEDDLDINGERIIAHKAKKRSIFPGASPDPARRAAKEPIDPYTLIIDNKLDILRPNLKDVMNLEDPYSYIGTAKRLNLGELQKTFFKTGVLQIVSARSRPDAFMSEKTATNPEEAHPGIVDIKITKVGLLWRKDAKKKKTRSPWQEWGAILTGAQLYFFRNTAWVKSLMHQYEEHVRKGHDGDPCYFKPPLDQFKPDALMSTDGAVALLDSTYKKHKHALVYVRHGGFEEVLLAENEAEMNDWLAKLNYAAAFRTSGVRMRGVVGGSVDGQGRRAIRRLDGDNGQPIPTPSGDVVVARSRVDHKMAQDILAARRDIMLQKVADADEKLEVAEKSLDSQLKNARHLQLLAPIQPKCRVQMLQAAAKMAAQLKWTRIDLWRLKCHRDILLLDLEDERQNLSNDVDSSGSKTPTQESENVPRSPTSPATVRQCKPLPASRASATAEDECPVTDVFSTPPTSASASMFTHNRQNSWDQANPSSDGGSVRKASVSSHPSSDRSIMATPPRIVPAVAKPEKQKAEEVDAEERDLLELSGLVGTESGRSEVNNESEDASEFREPTEVGERAGDRNRKVRRSLQRTLRESAGHLSGHLGSRRGREVVAGPSSSSDVELTEMLARGSGSFVVHGKKASVITFGQELQSMLPEDRRRASQTLDEMPLSPQATSSSHTNNEFGSSRTGSSHSQSRGVPGDGTDMCTSPTTPPDFQSVLTTSRDREDRGSAASASTATARSFSMLRRKYSTAQQTKAAAAAGGLVPPSDEDSDAAVSFSDGRRSPLPPIDGENDVNEPSDDDGLSDRSLSPSGRGFRSRFVTPEPTSPPTLENGDGGQANGKGKEGAPGPTQRVGTSPVV